MTTRELFKRRVIELIHWLPYDRAILKEEYRTCEKCNGTWYENWDWFWPCQYCCANWKTWYTYPITIWRVMKALKSIWYFWYEYWYIVGLWDYDCTVLEWKLTDEYGSECTDDDQTDETIEKLYNLIK